MGKFCYTGSHVGFFHLLCWCDGRRKFVAIFGACSNIQASYLLSHVDSHIAKKCLKQLSIQQSQFVYRIETDINITLSLLLLSS